MSDEADSLVLSIDQGTSATKAIVIDSVGEVIYSTTVPVSQTHPQPGWVEQDPNEIYSSVVSAIQLVTQRFGSRIRCVGLSTQRESAVMWSRESGLALGPVLGWQDRRTVDIARALIASGVGCRVLELSGLPIDPMFSALKFGWLLDSLGYARRADIPESVVVGTVDSWLMQKLTGEIRIEAGNASRTQLMSLTELDWNAELLDIFDIPRAVLAPIVSSDLWSDPIIGIQGMPLDVRVTAVLGDSHAALFGHGARNPGDVKVTYGTGSSVMGLAADNAHVTGLVRTVAWLSGGQAAYAFEGNILSTGATLVWSAQFLETTVEDLLELSGSACPDHGLNLVPAFAGLGAPWWDEDAQATISGVTLGTTREDFARAAFESIPLQIEDVLSALDAAGSPRIVKILVDGGPSNNDELMQLQADLSGRVVQRPQATELSALGAAHFAAMSVGLWKTIPTSKHSSTTNFHPRMTARQRIARRDSWARAVAQSRTQLRPTPTTTITP